MLVAVLVLAALLVFTVFAMYGAVQQIRELVQTLLLRQLKLTTTLQLMAVSWKRRVDYNLALDPDIWGELLRTEFRDAPDGIRDDD